MSEEIKLTKLAKCAGCGAKVGAGVLAKLLQDIKVHTDPNLLVGFDKSDDASVYKVSDEMALVQTVDFFPPIADDPYTFGAIAATNALSDVYAMGGEPKLALNIMAVPEKMPKEAVHQLLKGGYDKVYEAGAIITGGHSILDDEPKYGLAVTGFVHPQKLLKNCGAEPGDILFLTKPLGIGILTTAAKVDMVSKETYARAIELMTTLNKSARDVIVKYRVHACTDVTGFALLGHGCEMAQGSNVELHLDVDKIDLIPEALELARIGIIPEGAYRNRAFAEEHVDGGNVLLAKQDMLYDPQTSGGLLVAVHPDDADALHKELKNAVPSAQRIGICKKYAGGKYIFLHDKGDV
ncbi:MAG: selenide, water dikinase SelD [Phascolarctobacterium sp.]|nr:selenide, water dikinase SelD [Phascolarctobacterium sp.]